ncbi:MAG: Rha family transcriptional regulator [Oscillospiraceae bacterium]|nr:Rha family transcriptional regulator [Oscillospiraceae bacterium]
MNEVKITMTSGVPCVSSLQVAEDFGKKHKHVLEAIENIRAENSAVTPMFIESTYQAGTGKNYKCYDITRDGFSLLVMGFTGKEALDWKLRYIEAFNRMEQHINLQYTYLQQLDAQARADRAAAMRMNAENRRMKMLLDHPEMQKLSPESLTTLGVKRMEETLGKDMSDKLPLTEQTYSATEVGKLLGGISSAKIGRMANEHGLKTEEYGITVLDKSPYSAKQVPSFRYNRKGVEKLAELFGVKVSV